MAYQTVQGEALGRILMVLTNFTIGLSRKAREKPGKAGPIWRAPDASNQPEKKFHFIIFFSLTTFVSKIFQIYYYKNGEMPDLFVWLANKVPEGGVTGENFVNKFRSEFY